MKNIAWFNGKLYVDTLRQLRVMGSAYLVACLAISWIPPIVMLMGESWSAMDITAFVPVLFFLMSIGAITIVYSAFSFLFHRNASDIFHALPTKRMSVCISRFLAVITWLWGIIIVTVLGTVLLYGLLCGQWYFSYIPWLCGYYGVISLFFAASALCASALTGTRFAALAVTGLMAFMIRFLLLMLSVTILCFAPVVSMKDFGMLLNPAYNIATASLMMPVAELFVSSFYEGSFAWSMARMMTTLWPILYTFLIGILYAALGVVLYHRRNSETAEKSASNPHMQTLYRCGITLPVLLPLVIVLFVYGGYSFSGIFDHPGLLVVALVISLILYLSYEVITQKRLRGIVKTLPSYVVLVVFCVLFVIGAKGLAFSRIHILPEANEIEGIQLEMESEGHYYSDEDYYDLVMGSLIVQSDQANAIVSDVLRQNVADAEGDRNYFAYNGGNRYQQTLRIHLKNGGDMVRLLSFTERDMESLQAALSQDANYTNALRQLPSLGDVECIEPENLAGYVELTSAQMAELYNALTEEMASLSDVEFAFLINPWEMPQQKGAVSFGRIIFSGQYHYQPYMGSIEITPLTPNAFSLFIQMIQRQTNNGLANCLPTSPVIHTDIDMNLTLYDLQNGKTTTNNSSFDADENDRMLTLDDDMFSALNLIRGAMDQEPSDYVLEIYLSIQGQSVPDGYESQTGYVYLTQEQAQSIRTWLPFVSLRQAAENKK